MVVTFSFCPWRCFLFCLLFGRSGRTRRGPDFPIIGNHGLRISLSLSLSLSLERLWRGTSRYERHYSFYYRPRTFSFVCIVVSVLLQLHSPFFLLHFWIGAVEWRTFVFTYVFSRRRAVDLDGGYEPGERGTDFLKEIEKYSAK